LLTDSGSGGVQIICSVLARRPYEPVLRLVELSGIVDEAEGALGGFLDGDDEADAVGFAAGERHAGT
jgi:hypothetical protein